MSTGLHSRCNKVIRGVMHKRCSKCKAWKPRATYQRKNDREAVASWCRACQCEAGKAYSKARYVPRRANEVTLWQVWQ